MSASGDSAFRFYYEFAPDVLEGNMFARRASAQGSSTSESWACQIEAARDGSKSALGGLLSSCEQSLTAFAAKSLDPKLRSKFDTSDLVQEAFLDAHRRFDTFHGQTHEQLLAWLRRILINNMLNLSRGFTEASKRSVGRERPLNESGPAEAVADDRDCPVRKVQTREELDRVSACLAQLPVHYQQIIILRFNEGYSFAEIGKLTNRSEDAAQKLWERALVLLRKQLGL